jgi:hypothetical protein
LSDLALFRKAQAVLLWRSVLWTREAALHDRCRIHHQRCSELAPEAFGVLRNEAIAIE